MQLKITQGCKNYAEQAFGAKIYLDDEVKQIIANSNSEKTDFLRNMFKSYHQETPVLFTLTEEAGKSKRQITAINLSNGQIYPQKCPATRAGLNNLMGFLMHKYTYVYNQFWNGPNRLNYILEHLDKVKTLLKSI